MLNEVIFALHILLILSFLFLAARLGKEMLIAFFAVSAIFANIFVTKQIDLFHANITCSDAFAVSCILSLNLIQEKFGKKTAKKAVWIMFFLLFYLGVMSQIHLLYRPNAFDQTQSSFQQIFHSTPRLFAASIGVALLVQQIDMKLFSLIQNKFRNSPFIYRAGGAFIVSQALDTCLFSFLGLYGIVENLRDFILVSFAIKVGVFLLMSPFIAYAKRFVKTEAKGF